MTAPEKPKVTCVPLAGAALANGPGAKFELQILLGRWFLQDAVQEALGILCPDRNGMPCAGCSARGKASGWGHDCGGASTPIAPPVRFVMTRKGMTAIQTREVPQGTTLGALASAEGWVIK